MSKFCACFPVLAVAGVCAWLTGCGSEAAAPPPNSAPLASLGSELAVAQGSLSGALAEAQACLEDFKACRKAGGTDCAADLKACLPAPEIPAIDGLDEAKACLESFQDCRASGGTDCAADLKACLPAPSIPAPASGAAGVGATPGFFGFGGGKLPLLGSGAAGSGFGALAPAVDPAALAACKDRVSAAAAAQDPAAVGAAFKACVGDAFQDLFADVCERIATACEGAAAADLCDRLTDACNDPALTP